VCRNILLRPLWRTMSGSAPSPESSTCTAQPVRLLHPSSHVRLNQSWTNFTKLVKLCNALSGAGLNHTCGSTKQLVEQRRWLDRARSADVDWLVPYFRAVYGFDHEDVGSTLLLRNVVNVSQVSFFWNTVPRRSSFQALWSCVQCTRQGFRAEGALWAPSEEASANPVHRPARKHCLDMMLHRPHLMQANSSCGKLPGPGHALHAQHAMLYRANSYWAADYGGSSKQLPVHFPGVFVHRRAHAAALNHSWVEVVRVARDDIGDRHPAGRCTRGQLWFWVAPGSGIWLNVGRTQVMLSQHKLDRSGGCATARQRNVDTIQIADAFGGYSHEIVDCRATGLPGADDVWESACPPPHVHMRMGIPGPLSSLHGGVLLESSPLLSPRGASQASCECRCDPSLDYLNCNLVHSPARRSR
jgi:hypothetical protein